jgi:hypothetical protein
LVLHVFVVLHVVCLLICLALLWRLDWFPLRSSSSQGGAKRITLQRLLKPRTPDDGSPCRLASTPASAGGPAPVRPWREVKSRWGAPKRVNTEGQACPNQKCLYFGMTDAQIHAAFWRWPARPGRAHPDVSRSCLPLHVQCSAPYTPVPSENSLSADRRGVVCAGQRTGCFRRRAGLPLPTSHHHHLVVPRSPCTLRRCTSALSSTSGSRICSWMNCAPGYAAPTTFSGSGWPSIP